MVVTGDVSGLFTISTADTLDLVYIYGSGNCQNNDTMQLVINSLPTVTAGTDSTICISDSINLSVYQPEEIGLEMVLRMSPDICWRFSWSGLTYHLLHFC